MNHLHQIEFGFAICGLAGCVLSFALGIIAGVKLHMDMETRESEHRKSSAVRQEDLEFIRTELATELSDPNATLYDTVCHPAGDRDRNASILNETQC